jgi:hypothetical protein
MKKVWANSLFKNPEGWAGKAVGAPWRYRFMQIVTFTYGICLFLMFVWTKRSDVDWLGAALVVSGAVIAFPLMYLKALRHLYLELQGLRSKDQDAPPNRS